MKYDLTNKLLSKIVLEQRKDTKAILKHSVKMGISRQKLTSVIRAFNNGEHAPPHNKKHIQEMVKLSKSGKTVQEIRTVFNYSTSYVTRMLEKERGDDEVKVQVLDMKPTHFAQDDSFKTTYSMTAARL